MPIRASPSAIVLNRDRSSAASIVYPQPTIQAAQFIKRAGSLGDSRIACCSALKAFSGSFSSCSVSAEKKNWKENIWNRNVIEIDQPLTQIQVFATQIKISRKLKHTQYWATKSKYLFNYIMCNYHLSLTSFTDCPRKQGVFHRYEKVTNNTYKESKFLQKLSRKQLFST